MKLIRLSMTEIEKKNYINNLITIEKDAITKQVRLTAAY
jgi:hypothetical protein